MRVRKAAVAGKFYPSQGKELVEMLENILEKEKQNIKIELAQHKIIGGVVPHAGYMFSAYQAVHFFEILKQNASPIETVIILNPNHNGFGPEIATDINDYWSTPLGNVPLDKEFIKYLNIPSAEIAHRFEHSAEVMLPLLQYFLPFPIKIVPISLARQTFISSVKLADSIVKANETLYKRIVIIASTDFSHYLSPEIGKQLDNLVVEEIVKMNTQAIEQKVKQHSISMCGYGPVMTLIEYTKRVSAHPQIEILKRGHSGEIIQSKEVVNYISALVYEKSQEDK